MVRPVGELIRFVAGPDGTIVARPQAPPPRTRRLGDGDPQGGRRGRQAQRFRPQPQARRQAPADLGAQVERLLEEAALDALAIAHKSGRVAIGFGKTEAAVSREPVAAILTAADGSPDGARKIAGAAERRRMAENGPDVPILAGFTSAQLDLALGRSNVVHAALLAGPASNGFLARCQSLERFRTSTPDGRGEAMRG